MRKSLTRYITLALCFLFFFSIGTMALAQSADPFGLEGAVQGTGVSQAKITGENGIISIIIFNILGAVGMIFLILMIWGGIMWMTSGGNEKRLSTAKTILTTAVIGLIIIMTAYSTTYFIVQSLTDAQGSNLPGNTAN